ncbi:hypothetical protein DLAC_09280 [Tieghemostelium lacteum]|uniref:very-long-chain (3R)-3-hydroxyacyl-CoA dehydratase n=1 Tax=Tieghemostelium lacteum TaxID=361077 RepID=A0A151Z9L4_TIELA|nr:hypothetical protein DLAC_09280 [Tieghemostelium lacteum]|eukprot:KYQ90647.1 hypothetical protein DLAC_09280 [Tieghemostelium lacteum]
MGVVSKAYLVLYNAVQTIGWAYILMKLALHHKDGYNPNGVWDLIGKEVILFQGAAVLEIVHSLIGIVKTPVATTFVQVFSRVACVFLATIVPTTQNYWSLTLMLFCWSITEVIRYSFYALSIVNMVPYFLGWLRYTTFYILYPMGVLGETSTILASIPFVTENKVLTYSMPNFLNVSFDFAFFLKFSLIFYVVGLPWLYMHMISQRKRFIATGGNTKATPTSQTKKEN